MRADVHLRVRQFAQRNLQALLAVEPFQVAQNLRNDVLMLAIAPRGTSVRSAVLTFAARLACYLAYPNLSLTYRYPTINGMLT